MKLVLYGLGLGIVLTSFLTQFLASQLFGVTTTNLPTFLVVPLILGVVALAACFIPAERAARIEPLTAIRYE